MKEESLLEETLTDKINLKLAKMAFNTKARISIYNRLLSFVADGIPIYTALDIIYERHKKSKNTQYAMLAEWLDTIRDGGTFPDALRNGKWAPAIEIVLIESGDLSGNLSEGFLQAIKVADSSEKMMKAMKTALTYPLVLFVMLIGMLTGFSLKMVPIMVEIKSPDDWPEVSKGLYALSNFVTGPGVYVLIGIILFGVISIKSMPHWVGSGREVANRVPPWSIYKSYQGSGFMIALAAMLKAGIPLAQGLELIKDVSDTWIASHIEQMENNLREGMGNGDAMNTGFLNDEVSGDLIDYGKLSSFETAIYSIGNRAIEEGVEAITSGMGIIKSIMLALTGLLIGWIYYGFMVLSQSLAN